MPRLGEMLGVDDDGDPMPTQKDLLVNRIRDSENLEENYQPRGGSENPKPPGKEEVTTPEQRALGVRIAEAMGADQLSLEIDGALATASACDPVDIDVVELLKRAAYLRTVAIVRGVLEEKNY